MSNSDRIVSQQQVQLKVLEAYTRDVGRGVARIDYAAMDALGASTGDVIEFKGKRRTVAKCLPLYPSDEGRGTLRIDGLIRNNGGVAIGDVVIVKKIMAPPAEKVVVAPLEPVPPIDERYLADALEGAPVTKGDNVMVPYFGGRLTFQVVGVSPVADAALITQRTVFVISEKGAALRGGPQVTYEDIGGIKDEVRKVREMIELPLRHPEIFEKLGVEAPKGVLLYGPPGTGKTLLAKAVATESEANFISVKGPELFSKWVGESERGVREVFRRAKQAAPCVIFFDEIDSIAPGRGMGEGGTVTGGVVSQLLTELDGIQALQGVVVLAATNRIGMIDPALLRAGRFDKIISTPLPDEKAREETLQIHMKRKPISKEVEVGRLVEMTEGFNGADLAALVNTAVSIVLQSYIAKYPRPEDAKKHWDEAIVTYEHFQEAAKKVRSSRESSPMEKVAVPYYS